MNSEMVQQLSLVPKESTLFDMLEDHLSHRILNPVLVEGALVYAIRAFTHNLDAEYQDCYKRATKVKRTSD